MKYVTFKKVTIKNFLSVGEEPVIVTFNTGLNIITGLNKDKVDRRNGVGKSTIADAMYFSVFGDTIRELKKEFITNNVTGGKCEVQLEFNVNDAGRSNDYVILRSLNPSKIMIYKDGVDVTRDSISNTNSYISEIISSSPEVFHNCIIMTVNNTTPFMAKKKVEKRKFIEGILNLEVFSRMINDIRSQYTGVMSRLDIECAKFEEVSSNVVSYRDRKTQADAAKQRSLRELAGRIKANEIQISNYESELKKIEIHDVKQLKEQVKTLKTQKDTYDKNIITLEKAVTRHETDINTQKRMYNSIGTDEDVCPKCLRPMDEHDKETVEEEKEAILVRIDAHKAKIGELNSASSKLSKASKKCEKEIRSLTSKIHDVKICENNIENLRNRIKDVQATNKETAVDIVRIRDAKDEFSDMIEDAENRLKVIQGDIDEIKDDLHTMDVVKFVVSEEGVKSYIVKKILQLLNSKLAYYLKKLDSNCVCTFNEYFEEEIVDERGKICSYFNFSGAERKNIDLACLFAFMDVRRLQGDVAFNFSVYDELFDSSMDTKGVELVIDILKERIEQYNECIMVISHRKESVKMATGEIIYLEKHNGTTRRVENHDIST